MKDVDLILKRLDGIENDLKILKENNNQRNIQNAVDSVKQNYYNTINSKFKQNFDELAKNYIPHDCENHLCQDYINTHLRNFFDDHSSNEMTHEDFENAFAIFEQTSDSDCHECYKDFKTLMSNEFDLYDSLNPTNVETENTFESLLVDKLVSDIFEPLGNKQRLIIAESLYFENKTYSQLSKITKLRGGNLLFHLEKLQSAEIILQKQDRGEYFLTNKGYSILLHINQMQECLK